MDANRLAQVGSWMQRAADGGPDTGIGWIDAITHLPAGQGAIGAVVLCLLAVALTYFMGYRWLAILYGVLAVGFGVEWQLGLIQPLIWVNIGIVFTALLVAVVTMTIGERRRDRSLK